MQRYDLIYHCDGFPAIGMGHVRRAIDILTTVKRAKPRLALAAKGNYSSAAKNFFRNSLNRAVDILDERADVGSSLSVIDTMFDPDAVEAVDYDRCRRIKDSSDILVMINGVLRLTVPRSVDVLINHLPDIELRGNAGCEKYIGFQYAPAGRKFYLLAHEPRGEKVLAVLGTARVQSGPKAVLELLMEVFGSYHNVTLVVSPLFPTPDIHALQRRFPYVSIRKNVRTLIPLYRSASTVVCTYGNSTYESLAANRSTFVLSYKPFQNEYASYLENKGLVVNLGTFDNIRWDKTGKMKDPLIRRDLTRTAAKYFFSEGIDNIVRIIIDQIKKTLRE